MQETETKFEKGLRSVETFISIAPSSMQRSFLGSSVMLSRLLIDFH